MSPAPAHVLEKVAGENLEYTIKRASAVSFDSSLVVLAPSPGRGNGLFLAKDVPADCAVISGMAIEISAAEYPLFDESNASNYAFEHPRDEKAALLVLGLPSFLNHSKTPNCRYNWDYYEGIGWVLSMISLRPLTAGTELTFDYECSWFDVV